MGTKLWMDFREARNVETGMSHLIRELEMREKSKGTRLTGKQFACGESQPASGNASKVYEAALISLFWAPNGLNELPEVRFQSPWGTPQFSLGVLRNSPRGTPLFPSGVLRIHVMAYTGRLCSKRVPFTGFR